MSNLNNYLSIALLATIVFLSACGGDETVDSTFDPLVQFEIEKELINDYLIEKEYEADTTTLGVRVVVLESGEDQKVEEGQLVSFDFSGRFLDLSDDMEIIDSVYFTTTLFDLAKEKIDTSLVDNPISFRPVRYSYSANGWTLTSASGGSGYLPGFRDGLTELLTKIGKGGSGEIILPSRVAYGLTGSTNSSGFPDGVVSSNQVLIFEIFLRDFEDQ
ncbi:MAG: hypothetical protein WBA74_04830 [Cyclobacteriaceae bacterium]